MALGTQAMDAYKQSKLNEAKADIRAQMAANGELNGLTEAQINQKIVDSEQYKNVDKEYGVGSDFWTNGSAATGLLAGVLGGNVTGGMAAGAAPYMAALVKESTDNPAARAALHAIVSGALASAQGANPGAAAAGGFIASASADALAMAFYGTTADKLVGDEKTMISNLVVLLGAAAGAAAGGDGQAIASGGNAARVEVENNSFGVIREIAKYGGRACVANAACQAEVAKASLELLIAAGVSAEVASQISGNLSQEDISALASLATGDAVGATRYLTQKVVEYTVANTASNSSTENQPNVGQGLSNEDKAELGGTGSGTPGGWGPEDEENARNQENIQSVLDAAERLGVDIKSVKVQNGVAQLRINVTSNISSSDIQTLLNYAKSQGATSAEVNTGYIANEKLMEFMTRRSQDGRPFHGGTVIKDTSGLGDFKIVFK